MFLATANHGDSVFYQRVAGVVGLIILALMALARVLSLVCLPIGRRQLDNQVAQGLSQRRLGCEITWKPVLMLMVMVYAIVCIPLGWMWFQEKRTIAALPVVTVDDSSSAGEYRRVEGPMLTDAVYWAPRGTGRGGNNYSGAGVLVELPSGGEALLLAESLSVPNFVGVIKDTDNGALKAQGKVDRLHHRRSGGVLRLRRKRLPRTVLRTRRVMMLLSYP